MRRARLGELGFDRSDGKEIKVLVTMKYRKMGQCPCLCCARCNIHSLLLSHLHLQNTDTLAQFHLCLHDAILQGA